MDKVIAVAKESGFMRWWREERGWCDDHLERLFGGGVCEARLCEGADDFEIGSGVLFFGRVSII